MSRDRPKIERYGRAAQDALEATHYGVYGLAVEGASRDLDLECDGTYQEVRGLVQLTLSVIAI